MLLAGFECPKRERYRPSAAPGTKVGSWPGPTSLEGFPRTLLAALPQVRSQPFLLTAPSHAVDHTCSNPSSSCSRIKMVLPDSIPATITCLPMSQARLIRVSINALPIVAPRWSERT